MSWQPLSEPRRDPQAAFVSSPFARLARTHVLSIAGDALFAIALAGSVFFVDTGEARSRVALYLVLTIAPFAVASPLIGPVMDRAKGGRRGMVIGTAVLRALLCALLVQRLESVLFYPLAFGMLVLSKSYLIARAAIVPSTVRNDEELVEANAKLSLLSGLAVVVAVVPGGLLSWLASPSWVVGAAAATFVATTVVATRLVPHVVAELPEADVERAELHSGGIVLAASAMGLLRGIVGFLTFLLAFELREAATWQLGVAAGAAQIGFLIGSSMAPSLRERMTEESMLVGSLAVTAVASACAFVAGGLPGAAIVSLTVGATGSVAKQAFDAIVQRDAPDANRGRSFARFETRFQLLWVVGALFPVAIEIPQTVGVAAIVIAALAGGGSYAAGRRAARIEEAATARRAELAVGHLPDPATTGFLVTESAAGQEAARRRSAEESGAEVEPGEP